MKKWFKTYQYLPLVLICSLVVSAAMFAIPWLNENNTEEGHFLNIYGGIGGEANAGEDTVLGEYINGIEADEEGARAITAAVNVLNGVTIEAGATFSLNETLSGALTNEQHYQINQVATALYITSLQARCGIVERYSGQVLVDYAPIGFDAMVSPEGGNLVFTNISERAIRIVAEARNGVLTVKLMGAELGDGISIDLVANIVDEDSSETEDAGVEITYTVDTYRLYYLDNEVVQTEPLNRTVYTVINE